MMKRGLKMNRRKWLSAMFAVTLIFGILAGCAGSGGTKNDGRSASEPPSSSDTGGQNQSSNPPAEEKKEPTSFSIAMRTLNVTYVENHSNINEDPYVKALEEFTNTDLDIRLIPHNEYETKMVQMFATNDLPDVVQASGGLNGKELAGSVEAGLYVDLRPYLEEHGKRLLETIPEAAWARVTDEQGRIFGIPEYLGNPSRRATWIRKDLLDQTGLDVPRTVDEFLEVLRAFKRLGVEQPFAGREEFKYADTFFGAYDVFGYSSQMELVDGKMQPKFLDEENMMAAIQVYKTMFDEGLMSKEFATINANTFKSAITSGKAGIWSMNANELPIWGEQLKNNVPGAEVMLIPSPIGPDGKGGYYLYSPVTRSFMITKQAEHKAADIVKFFEWQTTDEAKLFFSFGLEGVDYTMENGQPKYEQPTSNEGLDKQRFLNYWLWMVQDTTYNELVLSQTEEGRALIEVYDTILANEGRDGYEFQPPLQAWVNNPDISPFSDRFPPLINEHIMRMVYGQEPISNWPAVIEEWRSKGGDQVIEEATERYNSGKGFYAPQR
jgi:putative aldouronate transport system substrate-binding protein